VRRSAEDGFGEIAGARLAYPLVWDPKHALAGLLEGCAVHSRSTCVLIPFKMVRPKLSPVRSRPSSSGAKPAQ